MPRYLEIAAEANKTAHSLLLLVPEAERARAAVMIGHLVNYGIRMNPRPAQSTVRLNAVRETCRGLPCSVSMGTKQSERTGEDYNAIQIVEKSQAQTA